MTLYAYYSEKQKDHRKLYFIYTNHKGEDVICTEVRTEKKENLDFDDFKFIGEVESYKRSLCTNTIQYHYANTIF